MCLYVRIFTGYVYNYFPFLTCVVRIMVLCTSLVMGQEFKRVGGGCYYPLVDYSSCLCWKWCFNFRVSIKRPLSGLVIILKHVHNVNVVYLLTFTHLACFGTAVKTLSLIPVSHTHRIIVLSMKLLVTTPTEAVICRTSMAVVSCCFCCSMCLG